MVKRYCRIARVSTALRIAMVSPATALASTVIGNGRDVLDSYLEATRFAFIQTLARSSEGEPLTDVCESVVGLDDEQKAFCTGFIMRTRDESVRLNAATPIVPLQLSALPLFDVNPDGSKRPVAAKTPSGPAGPITFDADRIRFLSPHALLRLFAHEMGHKITDPDSGTLVDDELPIGPFAEPGGGRRFLDAVGMAIADRAKKLRHIGSHFGINDHYVCTVGVASSHFRFRAQGASPRIFLGPENHETYESGIGIRPGDFQCEVYDAPRTMRVRVVNRIHEPAGCLAGGKSTGYVQTEIWLDTLKGENVRGHEPALEKSVKVAEKRIMSNPLCMPSAARIPFEVEADIAGERFSVQVEYQGSVGQTQHGITENLSSRGGGSHAGRLPFSLSE